MNEHDRPDADRDGPDSLDVDAVGDALTAWYWQGLSAGRLLLQRCIDCGAFQHYPRPFCLSCDGERLAPTEVSGAGVVYSQTEVQVDVLPGLAPPYVVALVQLDEGPRVLARLAGSATAIGDRVSYRPLPARRHLVFVPEARPAAR